MNTEKLTAVEWFSKWHEANREATFEEFTKVFTQALEMHKLKLNKSE